MDTITVSGEGYLTTISNLLEKYDTKIVRVELTSDTIYDTLNLESRERLD